MKMERCRDTEASSFNEPYSVGTPFHAAASALAVKTMSKLNRALVTAIAGLL